MSTTECTGARAAGAFALALIALAPQANGGQRFCDMFRSSDVCGPAMMALPGGHFVMGAQPGAPSYNPMDVPHLVEVSGFAIARDETSNAAYARFLNDATPDPAALGKLIDVAAAPGLHWDPAARAFAAADGHAERPVTAVTWNGALAYARWLNRRTGHTYTLPTEAQWEYAASADGAASNCAGSPGPSRAYAAAAGSANAHDLRHMVGNVWEWTLDCYRADFYFYSPRRDPRFLDRDCLTPIIRGGSFRDGPAMCNATYRVNYWWRGHPDGIGFRVARRLSAPETAAADGPGGQDG